MKGGAPVVTQPERHVRPGEGEAPHGLGRVLQLGAPGAKEAAAGRHVVEEVPNLHRGPFRMAGGLRIPTVSPDLPSGGLAARARGEGEPRHHGYARERLPPESEARDPEEIVDGGNLARGVAFEGEHEVFAPDPSSVVDHPDELHPTRLEVDPHRSRP